MKDRKFLETYKSKFSDKKLVKKVTSFGGKVGRRGVYTACLLYYAFKRKETPVWAKNIVRGILGYFISPIDFIPDLTPVMGYTDDVGIMAFGLTVLATYINDEVKAKARAKTYKWLGTPEDDSIFDEINQKIDEDSAA